jgi:predicted TIM-barrel fold metal-dependent hydrolase
VVQEGFPELAKGPIDAHAHVFRRDLPVVKGARYTPHSDASDETYLAAIRAAGLAGAILVQPSFLGTDNRYILRATARALERFRAVVVVEPTIASHELARLVAAGAIGVRFNLIGKEVPVFLEEPWRGLLARLSAHGLFAEIQAEGEQWLALRELLSMDELQIVIDHMGRPARADASDPAFRTVFDAAKKSHVWVKLSGPYRFAADARIVVTQLLQGAGFSRLIWGSDWPWTQHPEISSYAVTLSWLDEWIAEEAVRRAILEENPRRLMDRASASRLSRSLHVATNHPV